MFDRRNLTGSNLKQNCGCSED